MAGCTFSRVTVAPPRCVYYAGGMQVRIISVLASLLLCVAAVAGAEESPEESMRNRAAEGMKFPRLEAETLSGSELVLPRDTAEKVTIVAVAFQRGVQEQIDAWSEVFAPLKPQPGSADSSVSSESPQREAMRIYEIPMLKGRWRLISGVIDGGMRSGIPEAEHPYVATYYGDTSAYREKLSMQDEELSHLFILDPEGMIRFAAAGAPTEELSAAAEKTVRSLLQ